MFAARGLDRVEKIRKKSQGAGMPDVATTSQGPRDYNVAWKGSTSKVPRPGIWESLNNGQTIRERKFWILIWLEDSKCAPRKYDKPPIGKTAHGFS